MPQVKKVKLIAGQNNLSFGPPPPSDSVHETEPAPSTSSVAANSPSTSTARSAVGANSDRGDASAGNPCKFSACLAHSLSLVSLRKWTVNYVMANQTACQQERHTFEQAH